MFRTGSLSVDFLFIHEAEYCFYYILERSVNTTESEEKFDILGITRIHVLFESLMRGSISLSCPYRKYEATDCSAKK